MAKLIINEKKKLGHINAEIYGHFSEHLGRGIYEGVYVGEDSEIPNKNGMRTDVVEALKELEIPLLRWPGGCFADEYHWKDGIGPKEQRKKMINTHWGGVVEDNSFGTHEFFELCNQLACKTYVNGNVGSGTVQEMSEWIDYMTFDGVSPMADLRRKNGRKKPWKVDYFGVGNENWGCGGNMTPEYYGNLYRHFQTYIRQYNSDAPIKKVCCGANVADYFWTEGVMKTCYQAPMPEGTHGFMDGLSLHYYVHPEGWEIKGSATDFDEKVWVKSMAKALYIEELIQRHGAIMDSYDPKQEIGMIVDEWGTWFSVEPGTNPGFLYQQNTMRDALVAGITLNIFNKHCERVRMACIAQMVNVLQSVILTENEKMIKTPTYHVFKMYKGHQNAQLVDSYLEDITKINAGEEYEIPNLHESVSVKEDGTYTLTISNLSIDQSYDLEVEFFELKPSSISAVILTNEMHAFNTFEDPDKVTEKVFEEYQITEKGLTFVIPSCSVMNFTIK